MGDLITEYQDKQDAEYQEDEDSGDEEVSFKTVNRAGSSEGDQVKKKGLQSLSTKPGTKKLVKKKLMKKKVSSKTAQPTSTIKEAVVNPTKPKGKGKKALKKALLPEKEAKICDEDDDTDVEDGVTQIQVDDEITLNVTDASLLQLKKIDDKANPERKKIKKKKVVQAMGRKGRSKANTRSTNLHL